MAAKTTVLVLKRAWDALDNALQFEKERKITDNHFQQNAAEPEGIKKSYSGFHLDETRSALEEGLA